MVASVDMELAEVAPPANEARIAPAVGVEHHEPLEAGSVISMLTIMGVESKRLGEEPLMRLRFSRTTDYGLRAALEVARAPKGTLVTRHAIARATDAPASVLAQSLAGLVRAGVLDGQAGPRGGYSLARPADDVTIYDIVKAIDGEETEQRCVLREGACSWEGLCPFHTFLAQAQERFIETLQAHTLADVLTGAAPQLPALHPEAEQQVSSALLKRAATSDRSPAELPGRSRGVVSG